MSSTEFVDDFVRLLSEGDTLTAIERYYADDVCVFENRALSRAGRQQCLEYERERLSTLQAKPQFKMHKRAMDADEGHVFLEYTVRYFETDGTAARLELVAVQTWERGKIVQERFYYEGVVIEG